MRSANVPQSFALWSCSQEALMCDGEAVCLHEKSQIHVCVATPRCITFNYLAASLCAPPSAAVPRCTMQARIEEIGQALLQNTLLAAPDGLRRQRQGGITGG